MKEKYTLELNARGDDYRFPNCRHALCVDGLKRYFELKDVPEKINVIFSDRKIKEAYLIITSDSYTNRIDVLKSDGRYDRRVLTYTWLAEIAKKFDKKCYIAIEA